MSEQQELMKVEPSGKALAGFEGVKLTDTSLVFEDDITLERAMGIARLVGKVSRAGGWWVGDLVDQSEKSFGEAAATIAEETGWGRSTILGWRRLCATIKPEHRSSVLSTSTSIDLMDLYIENLDGYLELVRELEDHFRKTGENIGHKDVRKIKERYNLQGTLEGMPFTIEEELSQEKAARIQLQTELEDLKLRVGSHVRCPKCHKVQPIQDARVVAPA